MNAPAFLTTLSVHAGVVGLLTLIPKPTPPPQRTNVPVSIQYRKAPPPPIMLPSPPPRVHKRRRPAAAKAKPVPIPEKVPVPPPALLTAPAAAPSPTAVEIPVAPPAPAVPALPQISEEALPEGYVEEDGFSFAPLYRVTELPKLLKPLSPKYPDRAREFQKEGVVIIEADIDTQGHVISARIIEESGWGFGGAALKAVQETTFSPAKIGATAVPVRYRIPIRFKMDFS
jgi:protein TonB